MDSANVTGCIFPPDESRWSPGRKPGSAQSVARSHGPAFKSVPKPRKGRFFVQKRKSAQQAKGHHSGGTSSMLKFLQTLPSFPRESDRHPQLTFLKAQKQQTDIL